jgi:hypothetical protein
MKEETHLDFIMIPLLPIPPPSGATNSPAASSEGATTEARLFLLAERRAIGAALGVEVEVADL